MQDDSEIEKNEWRAWKTYPTRVIRVSDSLTMNVLPCINRNVYFNITSMFSS